MAALFILLAPVIAVLVLLCFAWAAKRDRVARDHTRTRGGGR